MNKILIVEDDQLVANIYRNKFAVDGYQAEVALDGEAGFELIKSFQPDIVILDLMIPKISGLELLKKIRAEAHLKQLPVVVFSNTYLSNMVQDAWKAGATKCLSKANCTPKQVLEVIRSLLPTATGSPGGAPAPATPKPAASANKANAAADSDAAFQAELRQNFVDSLPATLNSLRTLLQGLFKSVDETGRVKQLQELYRRIHALTGNAGIAGTHQVAQMSDAVEALVKELYEKPRNINASTQRTVALAIDFMGTLFEQARLTGAQPQLTPFHGNVLVVDDEAISQRAVVYALEKAKLKAVKMDDPVAALEVLTSRTFDLIFLDVDMPGMNGFELCTQLRALPAHKKTPVVFVTSLTDFESRANSTMSGGNDLIAKPFVFMELAVKALIYILRARLAPPAAVVNSR
jgi:DNA-binding response OmpR family regulator